MSDDECPDLAETLAEVDKITEDLDQAITSLFTWRDQCQDDAVRDVLAAVGDALGAGWAALQHARTKASDLPEPLRLVAPAVTPEDADHQATFAAGPWRDMRPRVRRCDVERHTPSLLDVIDAERSRQAGYL